MKNNNKIIAIYSRKSKYTGKGESIENQIEICKQYIRDYCISEQEQEVVVYEDEGYTGANTNRPEFQKMYKDIQNNKISTLICYRLDRLSRNVFDFCTLIEELAQYNVDFVSVKERFDTSTPAGKAMLMMCSTFAQFERDTIAERIKDNMMELAKTGRWLGGITPIGFRSEKLEKININGKKTSLYKLSFVDEEIDIVKLIFNKFIELKSQTKLETYLLQSNIKTKNKKDFSRWGIKNILKNPVYATADLNTLEYFKRFNIEIYADDKEFDGENGIMAYNKTTKVGKKKIVKQKDITDWIVSVGKHKGTISGKDWVMAQDILSQNENKIYRKPLKNTSFLAGLLRCSYCGSLMRPKIKTTTTSNGELRFDYICDLKMRSKGEKCKCKNINGNETDILVLNGIKSLSMPKSAFYKELMQISKQKFLQDKTTNEINTLELTYTKNDNTIKNLSNKIAYIDIDLLDGIQNEIRTLKTKNEEIRNKIKDLTKDSPIIINDKETAELIINILDNYISKFDELDTLTQRNVLKIFIGSLETNGEKVTMNLVGTRNHTQTEQNVLLGDSSK